MIPKATSNKTYPTFKAMPIANALLKFAGAWE
jgi:hypothetical protein